MCKVCYNLQDSLKVVLAEYPKGNTFSSLLSSLLGSFLFSSFLFFSLISSSFTHCPLATPRNCLDPQIGAWVINPESIRYLFPDIVRYLIPKQSQFEKHSQGSLLTSQELMSIDQYDCLALMDHLLVVLEEDGLVPPLQDQMDLIPVLSSI